MNYSLYIARRMSLSSGKRHNAPAVTVAVAAVALAVAVMLASVAIVFGFKKEIRDKIVGFNSHLSLFPSPASASEESLITLTPSLTAELDSVPFITGYSLQAAIPAIFKTSTDFKGVYLRGLSGDNAIDLIRRNLDEGELVDFTLPENKDKVVISEAAARQLGLKTGDKIDTYFISDEVRVRRLEVIGIYNTHFDQYDDIMVFGSLPLVQQLGQLEPDQGTFLQISTDNFDKIAEYTHTLQTHLNTALAEGRLDRLYSTDNVLNQGMGYFSWLALLDTNVTVVLVLMMIVACITLISAMLIIILEKKRVIGMLKALGAPTSKIREIFVFLACKIAIIGLSVGNTIVLLLIWWQSRTHFFSLDPDSYYIDFVPVHIDWLTVVLLNIGILLGIYLSLILPSRFVAGITPAETMRYE